MKCPWSCFGFGSKRNPPTELRTSENMGSNSSKGGQEIRSSGARSAQEPGGTPARPPAAVRPVPKKPSADEYQNILKPMKGTGRMVYHPDIPKTLTPKGYSKLRLMMSMANKQYNTLVNRLKKSGELWEDPEFPADSSSIGEVHSVNFQVEWKRPKDINPNAQFFVGGASRFDIEQGSLGDCWLLAVLSSLTNHTALFDQVVPKNQDMQGSNYFGVFRFRFWRFGQWTEVLVDDRLPVRSGTNNLLFMHSADNNEYWSALVEKAYAKLNGCYAHLEGGSQSEAMEDFTGGICEKFDLPAEKRLPDIEERLTKYEKTCCLMGCAVESKIIEAKLDNGLIAGHAYSVTGVRKVNYNGKEVTLVRCRNPWGGQYEWKGAWSDMSPEWEGIHKQEKSKLDIEMREDGEFWMSFDDFASNFTKVEVCHLGLESLEADQSIKGKFRMEESVFMGAWEKNVSAGGCINNRQTFWTNPQFRITVTDPDPDDSESKCTVIIGLMQKDVRKKTGTNFLTIGFMVYEIPEEQKTILSKAQFMTKRAVCQSTYINGREVTGTFRLLPGNYVIIPTTFQPGLEAKFIVRVYTVVAIQEQELDDDNTDHGIPEDIKEAMDVEESILQEDGDLQIEFEKVVDPITGSINALQLMEILNNSSLADIRGFVGFNKEMCRTMVSSVDNNLTGLVEMPEFMDLWKKAKAWKIAFLKHDVDLSGSFDAVEYREALKDCGFAVSNSLFSTLIHRYADTQTGQMPFEDFMMSVLRLRTSFETMKAHPKSGDGTKLFKDEDYMRFACYT